MAVDDYWEYSRPKPNKWKIFFKKVWELFKSFLAFIWLFGLMAALFLLPLAGGVFLIDLLAKGAWNLFNLLTSILQ